MTPARPNSSKRNSSSGFKPYTRGVVPIPVSSSGALDSKQSARSIAQDDTLGSPSPNDDVPVERAGFPTYAQYKQVEAAYIQSLTPRRQGKALISQSMFDRIWDVLHQPECPGETAQFRFWARKMFTLSSNHQNTLGFDNSDDPQEVLLHDNLLVAIQEQLYDLLCYCHGSTGHGGRDKTCALIRKHYTWVPKDLVSNFIKICPTCILKKCGRIDSALANQMAADDANFRVLPDYFSIQCVSPNVGSSPALPSASPSMGIPWPTMPASDGDSHMDEVDLVEIAYREAVQRARKVKASLSGMTAALPRGLPMVREVSLYKGLPNGWQYRHDNYASAYAEFMETKNSGLLEEEEDPGMRAKRPRVPSILPLWGPDYFTEEYPAQDPEFSSPNMLSMPDGSHQQVRADIPYRYSFVDHPRQSYVDFKEEPNLFAEQIDPMILQMSSESTSHQQTSDAIGSTEEDDKSPNQAAAFGIPMSLKRAAAPPRLELDFTTYRNGLREADITPDSPLMGINWDQGAAKPSPTGSDSSSSSSSSSASGASRLSVFGMPPPMSAATSVSPTSAKLQTPVDEFPSGTHEEGDPIGLRMMMKASVRVEPVEIELSDGIKQVCGL